MQSDKLTLILASGSPRRKELLGWIDIPFMVKSADIDEVSDYQDPLAICKDIAEKKGNAVLEMIKAHPAFLRGLNPFIVSADTIVTLDDVIFGKPSSVLQAGEMLMALSGKTHRVITAVTMIMVRADGHLKRHTFSCETDVTFSPIRMDILSHYLESKDSLDKAGAYGIQGKGLTFVSKVAGSYSNVVGFPLTDFLDELRYFLECHQDDSGVWRNMFLNDLSQFVE